MDVFTLDRCVEYSNISNVCTRFDEQQLGCSVLHSHCFLQLIEASTMISMYLVTT